MEEEEKKLCRCNCLNVPNDCDHKWDGDWVEIEGNIASVTCSICGLPAIDHDGMVLP